MADEVSGIEHDLARLERKEGSLREDIARLDVELAELELEAHRWGSLAREAEESYERQAIEAYKSGTTVNLDVLLASESLADVFDLIEIHAQLTAGYGQAAREVSSARGSVLAAQEEIDERKQELLAASRAVEVIQTQLRSKLSDRRAALASLKEELDALEAKARAAAQQAAATSGIPTSQALLDILQGSGPAVGIPNGFVPTGVSFEGLASWYGPGFEGNPTASGDIFDSSLYTAASKELPLRTWLYIEHGGRGVVVYVNDRGPYVGERILDLSRAAAEAIGLTGPGVGWVTAHILLPDP